MYIGRGSRFGNPFHIGKDGTREEVIALYREYARNNPEIYEHLDELRGKVLGCSCKPLPCHGDVLIQMLNQQYDKIVIGIDQSYTKSGISVCADGTLIKVTSIPFRGLTLKSDKRKHIANILHRLIPNCLNRAKRVIIICERIRTFSTGNISIGYIKATAALIATIVDVGYVYKVPVFSVDTRAWKSKVVGTSKHADPKDKKLETIKYVIKLGFGKEISRVNRKGKIVYDDDAADSACIALYGFIPKRLRNLLKEE